MTGIERLPKESLPRIGLERLPAPGGVATAKLTFEQRCLGAALFIERETTTDIAEFLGINVSTMRHIVKKSSPHYRNVRAKAAELGIQQFIDVYITPEDRARWVAFKNGKKKLETQAENPDAPNFAPNKNAAGMSGNHREVDSIDGSAHDFSVRWLDIGAPREDKGPVETQDQVGWYMLDTDQYGTTNFGPFGTSRAAWNHWFHLYHFEKYVEPEYEKERSRKRAAARQAQG